MSCYGDGVLLNGGATPPVVCTPYHSVVYRTTGVVLPTTVKTLVNFTAVETGENPAGMFNLTTDTATIPYGGNWTVTSTLEIILSWGAIVFGSIEINTGSGYVPYSIDSVEPFSASVVNVVMAVTKYFAAGETIRVYAQQNSGFNATINGTTRRVNCSITSACLP